MAIRSYIFDDLGLRVQRVSGTVRIEDYYQERDRFSPADRLRTLDYRNLLIHEADAKYEVTTNELMMYLMSWNRKVTGLKHQGGNCAVALTDIGYGIARASELILDSMDAATFPTFESFEQAAQSLNLAPADLSAALRKIDR